MVATNRMRLGKWEFAAEGGGVVELKRPPISVTARGRCDESRPTRSTQHPHPYTRARSFR